MDYLQKKINQEIGNELREMRKAKGYNQVKLQMALQGFYEERIKRYAKLTQNEMESFMQERFDKLDANLQKKLKKVGIRGSYHLIAISTISKYENGEAAIPMYYYRMVKEILGGFNMDKT